MLLPEGRRHSLLLLWRTRKLAFETNLCVWGGLVEINVVFLEETGVS